MNLDERQRVAGKRSIFRGESGFTLVELLLATTIFMIASAMAAVVTNSMLPGIRADGQARRLMALMQYGREVSIANRRNVQIQFNIPLNTVTLVLMNGGLATPIESLVFEYSMRIQQMGLPDTPDGFGATSPVSFGNSQNYIFEPDGSFVDETGLPINGSVYLGIGNVMQTARAITITGTTARPRLYRWSGPTSGGSWVGQ